MTNYLEPDPNQPIIEIEDVDEHLKKVEAINAEMLALLRDIKSGSFEMVMSHTFFERLKRVIADAEKP